MTDTADRDRAVLRARQQRWDSKVATDACWYISRPPPELETALAGWSPEAGEAALDIGCGPGTVTAHLADRFSLAVGLDVALGAAQEARRVGADRPHPPRFLLAEAPSFPFASGSFSLVFDRGVLHHVPAGTWPTYFHEVARILRPGGLYFQYCPERSLPGVLSYRGLRARAGRAVRKRPSRADAMRRAVPAAMSVVEIRQFPFTARNGDVLKFTFGLFRKERPAGPG